MQSNSRYPARDTRMHIIAALLLALATLAAAEAPPVFPRQTGFVNSTTTSTSSPLLSTLDPIYSSAVFSLNSLFPSLPPEIMTWTITANTTWNLLECAPSSTQLPTSLRSIFTGYEKSLVDWYPDVAAGIGGIQAADPQDVNLLYSFCMTHLCSSYTAMFSSVFYAAAASAVAANATLTPTSVPHDSSSAGGASPAGEVHVLGAALAGMIGVVALM